MNSHLPKEVINILETLETHGFEAFIVGGCVRDLLLGCSPKDWDITTSALPQDVIKLFDHTILTGIKHGTVTVVLNKVNYEITTYRIDGNYTNHRHPEKVTFTASLKEDLSRRDFTMNAIAYAPKMGIIDPFKGMEAIHKKIIVSVGDPKLRFEEDALRMLRALRFSSQLHFTIEEKTLLAIKNCKTRLENISIERIREELSKILVTKTPSVGILALYTAGLLPYILPELEASIGFDQKNPHHDKDVFHHILSVLDASPNSLIVRLSALLHDIGKPQCFTIDRKGIGHFYNHEKVSAEICERILRRLKFDNKTIELVCLLVKEHMVAYQLGKPKSLKNFMNRVGVENLSLLYSLQIADLEGHRPPHDYSKIKKIQQDIERILANNEPFSLAQLKVKGKDLLDIGYAPGKDLGRMLNLLLDQVIGNPALNTKEKLLQIAKQHLKNLP